MQQLSGASYEFLEALNNPLKSNQVIDNKAQNSNMFDSYQNKVLSSTNKSIIQNSMSKSINECSVNNSYSNNSNIQHPFVQNIIKNKIGSTEQTPKGYNNVQILKNAGG